MRDVLIVSGGLHPASCACVLRATCCVLRVACCVLRVACCVLRAASVLIGCVLC